MNIWDDYGKPILKIAASVNPAVNLTAKVIGAVKSTKSDPKSPVKHDPISKIPVSASATPVFSSGEAVQFKSDASVCYDVKNGSKLPLPPAYKVETWYVDYTDTSGKFVFLTSEIGRIKAKITDLLLIVTPTEEPLKDEIKEDHMFAIGTLVRIKNEAQYVYNKNGAKLNLDGFQGYKKMQWRIVKYEYANASFVYIEPARRTDGSEILKIKVNDLYLGKQQYSYTSKPTAQQPQANSSAAYKGTHQFTALGLSGSGKTCFMAGMYYKMSGGVNGYTLKTDDDNAVRLTANYEQMANADLGANRYPSGTDQSSDYTFELQYGYKPLDKFRWIDYAGGILKSKNTGDAAAFNQLKIDIEHSDILYIFVDGSLFLDDELEYISSDSGKIDLLTDIVMDSCARQINHFLSDYTGECNKLPPIAIVITKYDLAVKALGKASGEDNAEMLYQIIKRAFNPLFPDPSIYSGDDGYPSMVGIIPVSLGYKISENGDKGKLRPINMHLPVYIGIWFMLRSTNSVQDSAVKKLAEEIEDSGVKFWLSGQTGRFSVLAEGYLKKLGGI